MSDTNLALNRGKHPSLWHRLNQTPLRDLVRGRLSGRLDVEAVMDDASLPDEARGVIRGVVRRLRLSRIEKAEVARELAAHFEDGLSAGASSDAIITSFGDTRVAARLIRRSRKRARPLQVKLVRRSLLAVGSVFAATLMVYVWFAVRIWAGEAVVRDNFVAEFNAQVAAIPEGDRAWPEYRAAYLALADDWELHKHCARERPGGAEWEACSALVARHAESIERVRRAADRPHLGSLLHDVSDREVYGRWPTFNADVLHDENPMLYSVLVPHYRALRTHARLLYLDGFVAIECGDADRVYADLKALLGVTAHQSQGAFVIDALNMASMVGLSADFVVHLLRDAPELLTEAQLTAASHRFAGIAGGGRLTVPIKSERRTFEDFLQRFYTDDGSGDGILTADVRSFYTGSNVIALSDSALGQTVLAPVLSAVVARRTEVAARFDQYMELVERRAGMSLWERDTDRSMEAFESIKGDSFQMIRYLPVATLAPALSHTGFLMEVATQRRDAALTAVALEVYRRRHGGYPAALSDLVPAIMPSVPLDRYDGRLLKYRVVDGRALLYSVGVDRDDDGGRLPDATQPSKANEFARTWRSPSQVKEAKRSGKHGSFDGDWLLFPPVDDPESHAVVGLILGG